MMSLRDQHGVPMLWLATILTIVSAENLTAGAMIQQTFPDTTQSSAAAQHSQTTAQAHPIQQTTQTIQLNYTTNQPDQHFYIPPAVTSISSSQPAAASATTSFASFATGNDAGQLSSVTQSGTMSFPDDLSTEPSTGARDAIIGSDGPDKRELDSIQRALDSLKDKRSADYGWGNDTHMVILAKEVRTFTVIEAILGFNWLV